MARDFKGKSIDKFPSDYVLIDLETTGYDPTTDEIIEIGAVRVKDNEIVEEFNTLVTCFIELPEVITDLTNINLDMLKNAPTPQEAIQKFSNFVSDSIVVAHNAHFDINFLYDNFQEFLNQPFRNDFVDTLKLSRRIFKDEKSYRLENLAVSFGFENTTYHRALEDCYTTFSLYEYMRKFVSDNNIDFGPKKRYRPYANKISANSIIPQTDSFDDSHPIFDKVCVFTGTLEALDRKSAMQKVVDLGGVCSDRITQKTNFLILGNRDYKLAQSNPKSTKHRKAEEYKVKGFDIEIISESVFLDLITE